MNTNGQPETLEQAEARSLGLTVSELRDLRAGCSPLSADERRQRLILAADWRLAMAAEMMKLSPTRAHAEHLREARREFKQLVS